MLSMLSFLPLSFTIMSPIYYMITVPLALLSVIVAVSQVKSGKLSYLSYIAISLAFLVVLMRDILLIASSSLIVQGL